MDRAAWGASLGELRKRRSLPAQHAQNKEHDDPNGHPVGVALPLESHYTMGERSTNAAPLLPS